MLKNDKKMKNKLVLFILFVISYSMFAQEQDTIAHSNKKNTIRWNLTPMFIIGPKSIVLGYERVITPHQTASINIGYLEKAPFEDKYGNVVFLFDDVERGGYDISIDYRFYFKNRNKRLVPDGVYWGPYFSYINLWYSGESTIYDDNGISINTIGINTDLKMYSVGLQLGYQFVIKNRFTVDLIFIGPSYTHYSAKLKFNAKTELDENSEFYQNTKEILEKLVPGGSIILNEQEVTSSGKVDFDYFGFRYVIQIGYRF